MRASTWRDFLVRVTLVEGGPALQARAQLAARYGTELIGVLWPAVGASSSGARAARLAEVRLCAVCLRRWVLLQDASGEAAVIDPWGRVVLAPSPGCTGRIEAVRLHAERSLYERKGDMFMPVLQLGLMVGLVRRGRL